MKDEKEKVKESQSQSRSDTLARHPLRVAGSGVSQYK